MQVILIKPGRYWEEAVPERQLFLSRGRRLLSPDPFSSRVCQGGSV